MKTFAHNIAVPPPPAAAMPVAEAQTFAPPPTPIAVAPETTPWITTYLTGLAAHTQKARAAQAAGLPLPEIARQRRHNPAFAEEEALRLEAFADLLESEAVRRVRASIEATETNPYPKPPCTDTLLLRLLNIFHPSFNTRNTLARSRTGPKGVRLRGVSRPPAPDEDGNFQSRAHLFAFRQWERQQAIVLALDFLFNPGPIDIHQPTPEWFEDMLTPDRTSGTIIPPSRTPPPVPNPAPVSPEPTPSVLPTETTDDARGMGILPMNQKQTRSAIPSPTLNANSAPETADSIDSIDSIESIESIESTAPAPTFHPGLTPTEAWHTLEHAITCLRADIKHHLRHGYSKSSQLIVDLTTELADYQSLQSELPPPTDPDPPP